MKKIAIISANPVEFYPPLWNLLRDDRWKGHRVCCCTMFSRKYPGEKFAAAGIRICRTTQHCWRWSVLNLMDRLWFSLRTLAELIFFKPDAVMYIESNSALPVYWYRRFFNRHVRVFIHYYEYAEPRQYAAERWNGFCHKKEAYLYRVMQWCSHCNQTRLELSCRDWGLNIDDRQHVVPNYPPRKWQVGGGALREHTPHEPLRLVYVGSLSTATMFVVELLDWIISLAGAVTLDIFAFNLDPKTSQYVQQQNSPWIAFHSGVCYDDLLKILPQFDVGLILYRGLTLNYRYNECNKLFEYLTCGLDVWFSSTLELIRQWEDDSSLPRVRQVDFTHLNEFDWRCAVKHEGGVLREEKFVAEDANAPLIEALLRV